MAIIPSRDRCSPCESARQQARGLARVVPAAYRTDDPDPFRQVMLGAIRFLLHFNAVKAKARADHATSSVANLEVSSKKRDRDEESDSLGDTSAAGQQPLKKPRIETAEQRPESAATVITQAIVGPLTKGPIAPSNDSVMAVDSETASSSDSSSGRDSDDDDTDTAIPEPDPFSRWSDEAVKKHSMIRLAAFKSRDVLPEHATLADLAEYDRANNARTTRSNKQCESSRQDHARVSARKQADYGSSKLGGCGSADGQVQPGQKGKIVGKGTGRMKDTDLSEYVYAADAEGTSKKSKRKTKQTNKDNPIKIEDDSDIDETPDRRDEITPKSRERLEHPKKRKDRLPQRQTLSAESPTPAERILRKASDPSGRPHKSKSGGSQQQSRCSTTAGRNILPIHMPTSNVAVLSCRDPATARKPTPQKTRSPGPSNKDEELVETSDASDLPSSSDEEEPDAPASAQPQYITTKTGKTRKKAVLAADVFAEVVKRKNKELAKSKKDLEKRNEKINKRDQQLHRKEEQIKHLHEILEAAGVSEVAVDEILGRMKHDRTAKEALRTVQARQKSRG